MNKRRNNRYRIGNLVDKNPPTKKELQNEKEFLMNQYSFIPCCDKFEIKYVHAQKFNK